MMSGDVVAPGQAQSNARLSLIFKPGGRPAAGDVLRLAETRQDRAPGFAVSHQPAASAGWLELLAGGMTFDLVGLASAPSTPLPAMAHFYGFPAGLTLDHGEAITLTPGEELRGSENLLPVVRAAVGLASRLAGLAEISAVVWHPARCAMAPAAFVAAIGNWLNGGPFPALGLTALFCDSDDAICSEGLAFFIGRELRIEPVIGKSTSHDAQIATRLINHLVGNDAIHQRLDFMGTDGEHLSVEPSGNDGFLRVWRKS